jgi:hypothetical protein
MTKRKRVRKEQKRKRKEKSMVRRDGHFTSVGKTASLS